MKPLIVIFLAAAAWAAFLFPAQANQGVWPCYEGDLKSTLNKLHKEKVVARGIAGPYAMLLLANKRGSWTMIMKQPLVEEVYCIAATGEAFALVPPQKLEDETIRWNIKQ